MSMQLGFDALLGSADAENHARQIARETAHLPGTMETAIPHYRILLRQHHAAMLAANVDEAIRLRREARSLALKLNGGERGIIAGPDAPGCVLERETAAAPGTVPLWGQLGSFAITLADIDMQIDLEGLFGIGGCTLYWPAFSARAVDTERPFISDTGFRSFLGVQADPLPGLSPEDFVRRVIESWIEHDLKGRLHTIAPRYRKARA